MLALVAAGEYNEGVTSPPTRVFLLDHHEVVRRGLRDLLESDDDIEIVGESGTAREATARIPALRPDVAVLDARLPTAVASTLPGRALDRSPGSRHSS